MADDGRPDTVVSLRQELGAPADPEFRIDLPPSWVQSGVSEEDQAKIASRMHDKARQAHRPDVANLVDTMLEESFSAMRKSKVHAVFMPGEFEDRPMLPVPASILVTVRTGVGGRSVDDFIRGAIVEAGAKPLEQDPRWMKFSTEQNRVTSDGEIIMSNHYYLTPIPGAQRTRALQLQATYGRTSDMSTRDPRLVLTEQMFDMCVSSLRWVRKKV